MKTMTQFAREHKITIRSERVASNPNFDDFDGDHWRVTLRKGNKSLTIYFSKGYGHNGKKPRIEELLNSIASDITEGSFEDWANNLGYDVDSRKAEKTYKACLRQTEKAERFLGEELLNELRYEVEP